MEGNNIEEEENILAGARDRLQLGTQPPTRLHAAGRGWDAGISQPHKAAQLMLGDGPQRIKSEKVTIDVWCLVTMLYCNCECQLQTSV